MTKKERELAKVILAYKVMLRKSIKSLIVVEANINKYLGENFLGDNLKREIIKGNELVNLKNYKEFDDDPLSALKEDIDKELLEESLKEILDKY